MPAVIPGMIFLPNYNTEQPVYRHRVQCWGNSDLFRSKLSISRLFDSEI